MRKLFATIGIAAALVATAAYAGGMWPALPNATNSANTFPLTGNETIPADTNLTQGLQPATEIISTNTLASFMSGRISSPRNALVGGDFGSNPWARGTPSGTISNTLTYWADRWWSLGGASSSITITKQTGASDIFTGTTATQRFQRTASNADTTQICTGQVLETQFSQGFAGNTAVFSFTGKIGANFSAANNNVFVTIGYGTGTDGTSANFAAGSWTGYATPATYYVNGVAVTPTSGAAPVTLTTSFVRNYLAVSIPATANQVGVKICYTPVGTAGANDWFEFSLAQLEAETAAASGATPSFFEYLPPDVVLGRAQRYFYGLAEPATAVGVGAMGSTATTSTCITAIAFPVTMRAAPTFTAYGTALSASTWKIAYAASNVVLASTFYVTTTANTPQGAYGTWTVSGTPLTAGQACYPIGANGGSILGWSADL
jgi:hypothetical protein